MRFANWINKATDPLIMSNTYCFSTATMVTRTPFSITLLYIACFVVTEVSMKKIFVSIYRDSLNVLIVYGRCTVDFGTHCISTP
jgi:hypothetical protein